MCQEGIESTFRGSNRIKNRKWKNKNDNLNDRDFNDERGDKKYVHANNRYGVNCGSKIKYSRYRQILADHGKQSSDTGYSFKETYSPYRHYGSKENQTRYNMDRHEGQNRYPNRVHSNGYNTYNDQYTSRVVDNSAQRVDKERIFTLFEQILGVM